MFFACLSKALLHGFLKVNDKLSSCFCSLESISPQGTNSDRFIGIVSACFYSKVQLARYIQTPIERSVNTYFFKVQTKFSDSIRTEHQV